LIIYKHKSGRKHYEVGFGAFGKDLTPDGEISQIRRAIEKKETPQSPTTSNQQVQK
jgi:hypothetical protein